MALSSFLEFWAHPPQWAAPDPVQKIYRCYLGAVAELDDTKSDARDFIIPADVKGKLVPIFDPDRAEEVATLARQIDAQKAKIKAIDADIEAICTLAGAPSMIELEKEHERLKHSIRLAEATAGAAMRRAINGRGRSTQPPRPEEIATRPELVELYAKADILRAESEPKIASMFGRLEQIREILGKYNNVD